MEKVEPKERFNVWKGVSDRMTRNIQEKYSSDAEKETACIDIYVNCNPYSSWEDIAKALYQHQQVAAVDEVRSYLSPRGEPCFWSSCIHYTGSFNSHTEILRTINQ